MLWICSTHNNPFKIFWEFQTISIERSTFLINSQSPQNFFHFYGPAPASGFLFLKLIIHCDLRGDVHIHIATQNVIVTFWGVGGFEKYEYDVFNVA